MKIRFTSQNRKAKPYSTCAHAAAPFLAPRPTTLPTPPQMLRRPGVPLWYILVGIAVVVLLMGIGWRWCRPPLHVPSAEAQNWYDIGTNALRDEAFFQASKAFERAITIDDK